MEALKMIGITSAIVVPLTLVCTFLSGKSKKFMDKLSGKENRKDN